MYAEGESLFNDVAALIIFYFVALPLVSGTEVTVVGLNLAIAKVVVLSVTIGVVSAALGYLGLKLIKASVEQFIIIYLVAILSFVAAEHLHISGILATVSAIVALKYAIDHEMAQVATQPHRRRLQDAHSYYDLVISLLRQVPALTPRGFIAYKKESHYVGLFANAVVFISMANLLDLGTLLGYWREILLVFLLTTAIRALFVHPMIRAQRLPLRWAHVLTLAGMKGGLAIIMVHSLPADFAHVELFEAVVIGVVLLSIFVYSFLLLVYLAHHRDAFEADRRHQDAAADIQNLIRQFRDIVEKDPLTGLFIPSVFRDIVGNEVSRATRYGIDLSLIVLRPCAHAPKPERDKAVLSIARTIGMLTRGTDIVGHLRSDTVAIIATNTDRIGAQILLDRISQEADVAGVELNATVVELEQGDEESMLLERAEADLASA